MREARRLTAPHALVAAGTPIARVAAGSPVASAGSHPRSLQLRTRLARWRRLRRWCRSMQVNLVLFDLLDTPVEGHLVGVDVPSSSDIGTLVAGTFFFARSVFVGLPIVSGTCTASPAVCIDTVVSILIPRALVRHCVASASAALKHRNLACCQRCQPHRVLHATFPARRRFLCFATHLPMFRHSLACRPHLPQSQNVPCGYYLFSSCSNDVLRDRYNKILRHMHKYDHKPGKDLKVSGLG